MSVYSRLGQFNPETEPFSEETLAWLRSRNAHELADAFERQRPTPALSPSDSGEEPPAPVDYDSWTVERLKKELDDRREDIVNPEEDPETVARLSYATSDRKSDLVGKLRADDEVLAAEEGE
jgi:hypothetical protein